MSTFFDPNIKPPVKPPVENNIQGLPGDDSLIGTGITDVIIGYAGNDLLIGLQDNDDLVGGYGSDTLIGGKGLDVLEGGFGNDILVGGAGRDFFSIGPGLGIDTILDFDNSKDFVQLILGLTFEELLISPGPNGTLIRLVSSGEVLVSLIGVAPNLIGSEDFISTPSSYIHPIYGNG